MIKNQGFTLIECLLVVSILFIMILGSVFYIQSYHSKIVANMLLHSFHFARQEAITRNQQVRLCGTENELHCTENWSKGYMIYIPSNPIQIIRAYRFSYPIHIHSQKLKIIKFTREGRLLTRGSLWIEDRKGNKHYKIVFYDSGRPRMEAFS